LQHRRARSSSHLYIFYTQIYYFDNKHFGEDTPMSLDIPRLQFYDGETFSRFVMADTSGLVGTNPRLVFGASKVNYKQSFFLTYHKWPLLNFFLFPKHTQARDDLDVVYRRTLFTNQAPAEKRRGGSGCKRTWEEIIEQKDGGNKTTSYLTVNKFNTFANKYSFLIVAPFFYTA
jgi:hypothetical protein